MATASLLARAFPNSGIPKEPQEAGKNEFQILTTQCQTRPVGWMV